MRRADDVEPNDGQDLENADSEEEAERSVTTTNVANAMATNTSTASTSTRVTSLNDEVIEIENPEEVQTYVTGKSDTDTDDEDILNKASWNRSRIGNRPFKEKKKLSRSSGSGRMMLQNSTENSADSFRISVIDVASNPSLVSGDLMPFRLELPRVGSFECNGSSTLPPPQFYLPSSSRSASLSILPGEDSTAPVSSAEGSQIALGPQRSSSATSLSAAVPLTAGLPHRLSLQPRRHSATAAPYMPGKKSKSPSRNGIPTHKRRLSDFQTLKSSLGMSLLSLASSYGKPWKQVSLVSALMMAKQMGCGKKYEKYVRQFIIILV